MPDRDSSYRSGGGGGGLSEEGSGLPGGSGGSIGGNVSGSGSMGGGGALGNGCGNGAGGGQGAGLADGVCRDFIRNVCKRGKRCRFKHPDFNEVPDLGVQKNEFIFCHDHQNKECMRANCRFVHGSKEDEDYYKKSGELPLRLRGNAAARLGLSPMDLPHSRAEVPICRDFLTGECQRGNKCKFRHVQKDYEYETSRVGVGGVMGPGASGMVTAGGGIGVGGGVTCGGMQGLVGGGGVSNMMGIGCPSLGGCRDPGISGVGGVGVGGMSGCLSISSAGQRRFDRSSCSLYDPLLENGLFDAGALEASMDHTALQLKRRRLEGLRLADGSIAGHYELGIQAALPPRPLEYRFLEEENCLLRKRVEDLKKQVSNLIATNEVLLDQNAQFRNQAKVMTLSTPAHTEQSLVPPVGSVSSYNHSIAQTHTTLSSAGMQPRPVTQQDLVVSTGVAAVSQTNSAQPTAPPPHLNPDITPLSAALVQTIAQGMAPAVSMASVSVSVAPVSVTMSMTQPLPCITMSHATSPMVAYPIVSQSMRINTLPH